MSEQLDKEGCWLLILSMAVAILLIDMGLDLYAGKRDSNYIKNLQQRVAILEQQINQR